MLFIMETGIKLTSIKAFSDLQLLIKFNASELMNDAVERFWSFQQPSLSETSFVVDSY